MRVFMYKRLGALLLCFALLSGLLPTAALAAEPLTEGDPALYTEADGQDAGGPEGGEPGEGGEPDGGAGDTEEPEVVTVVTPGNALENECSCKSSDDKTTHTSLQCAIDTVANGGTVKLDTAVVGEVSVQISGKSLTLERADHAAFLRNVKIDLLDGAQLAIPEKIFREGASIQLDDGDSGPAVYLSQDSAEVTLGETSNVTTGWNESVKGAIQQKYAQWNLSVKSDSPELLIASPLPWYDLELSADILPSGVSTDNLFAAYVPLDQMTADSAPTLLLSKVNVSGSKVSVHLQGMEEDTDYAVFFVEVHKGNTVALGVSSATCYMGGETSDEFIGQEWYEKGLGIPSFSWKIDDKPVENLFSGGIPFAIEFWSQVEKKRIDDVAPGEYQIVFKLKDDGTIPQCTNNGAQKLIVFDNANSAIETLGVRPVTVPGNAAEQQAAGITAPIFEDEAALKPNAATVQAVKGNKSTGNDTYLLFDSLLEVEKRNEAGIWNEVNKAYGGLSNLSQVSYEMRHLNFIAPQDGNKMSSVHSTIDVYWPYPYSCPREDGANIRLFYIPALNREYGEVYVQESGENIAEIIGKLDSSNIKQADSVVPTEFGIQFTIDITNDINSSTGLYVLVWEREQYMVTVSGRETQGGSGAGMYWSGDSVTISAGSKAGYTFAGWEVTSGNVTLTDPSSPTTTFIMPAGDVAVTANWTPVSGGGETPGGDNPSSGGGSGGGSSSSRPDQPAGPSTGGSDGWIDIEDEIAGAEDGGSIVIDMNGETEVPGEVFEAVAGKDVDVTFELEDGLSWTVNGQDVPQGTSFSALNLGASMGTSGIPVSVINAVTGETGAVQLTLSYDGEFGFALTLTAPLGRENAGYWANLYHYDEDSGRLVFETSARIAEDGSAALRMTHASQYAIVIDTVSHELPFTDVPEDFWANDAIAWAYQNGYINGTTATTFSPNTSISRQQVWMILARLSGASPANMAEARQWAMDNGISDGTNSGGAVTRQQLAALLFRFARLMGYDTTQGGMAIREYADYDQISGYALEAMDWAVNAGIINGTSATTLTPQGTATRAQFVVMLYRFRN